MDVDFAVGFGSHDFEEPAQKRQRLSHDPSYTPAPNIPASTIGELESWYQSANDNQQLDSEGLWTPGFHDLQNNASIWPNSAPEFTLDSNEYSDLRGAAISLANLPGLQIDPPSESQQNYHDPVAEESTDGEVAEGDVDLSQQEDHGLLCFGMVGTH
jgi:hypothetical protein